MSKLRHTPGRWEARINSDQICVISTALRFPEDVIAVLLDKYEGPRRLGKINLEHWEKHLQAAKANARLITAAPDMLLALQLVAERDDLLLKDPTVYKAVFEAILKAEGRE